MKKWMIVLIVVVALGAVAAGFAMWGVGKYNNLITLGQGVDMAWSQVDVVLQRRNDLIPNLVNTAQAYAMHEQEVFEKVAAARAMWNRASQGGTIKDKIAADGAMQGALLNLMAMVERYPDLKANEHFMALMDELAGTENRIAVERKRYNESAIGYNNYAKIFPNNIVVKFFNFPKERDFFKSTESAQKAPEVKISYPPVQIQGLTPDSSKSLPATEVKPTTPPAQPAPAATPPAPTAATTPPPAAQQQQKVTAPAAAPVTPTTAPVPATTTPSPAATPPAQPTAPAPVPTAAAPAQQQVPTVPPPASPAMQPAQTTVQPTKTDTMTAPNAKVATPAQAAPAATTNTTAAPAATTPAAPIAPVNQTPPMPTPPVTPPPAPALVPPATQPAAK